MLETTMRLKKYTQSKYKHSFVEALQKWDDDADDDEKYDGESTEERKKTEKRTYKAHMKKKAPILKSNEWYAVLLLFTTQIFWSARIVQQHTQTHSHTQCSETKIPTK